MNEQLARELLAAQVAERKPMWDLLRRIPPDELLNGKPPRIELVPGWTLEEILEREG